MKYFVAYTKDGNYFNFNKRCTNIEILKETNDMMLFLHGASKLGGETLAIIPKTSILYILAREG